MNILELQKSAAAGELTAQTVLGACYVDGIDVEVDHPRALELLTGPAQARVPRACYYLARVYSSGRGVAINMPEAVRLFRIAAENGEYYAMIELGRMYAHGRGVPVDAVMARKWYSAAIASQKGPNGEEPQLGDYDEELQEAMAYLAPKA